MFLDFSCFSERLQFPEAAAHCPLAGICSGTFVLWSSTDDLAIVTTPMNGEPLEPWQQLCELAAIEQDPDHLVELIRVIDRLLKEKEQRSQKARHAKRSLGRKRL